MTLKTDNDGQIMGSLLQAYMLEKYVRALENDLMFARFASDGFTPKPLTWLQRSRRGFAAYTKNLMTAILGRTPDNDQYCDCWEDDE
jgi:hypothetical protein